MRIDLAGPDDVPELARLLWDHASPEEQTRQEVAPFAADLAVWWAARDGEHEVVVARSEDGGLVGMAWLALLPRVPRPGCSTRVSGDLQSVYVEPAHRGRGLGAALIEAASRIATKRGADRVTVSAGSRSVPLYERCGYATSPQLLERA